MSPDDDVQRLFFALWPDVMVREQIEQRTQSAVAASGGRRVPTDNFHITLLFMGNVGATSLALARSAAASLASPCFDLVLDRIQAPARARVMWLGAQHSPPALMQLAQALRLIPLPAEREQAFRPHVTLVRDPLHRTPIAPIEPVHWAARDFVLVQSRLRPHGSDYTVLDRWPLRQ
jgi:RNA 2',3'-cyclic 3'-phosphodiesterase